MAELLPERLGVLGTDDDAKQKPKKRSLSILEWLQCYAVYVAVTSRKHPECIPDLIGYQSLVIEAYMEYKNDCWNRLWPSFLATNGITATQALVYCRLYTMDFGLCWTNEDLQVQSLLQSGSPIQRLWFSPWTFCKAISVQPMPPHLFSLEWDLKPHMFLSQVQIPTHLLYMCSWPRHYKCVPQSHSLPSTYGPIINQTSFSSW